MGRHCAACSSEHSAEIDRKLKAGNPHADVSRWLKEKGVVLTPQAIGRHAKEHLGVASVIGRRTMSADLAEAIRDVTHQMLESGELVPTLKDGLRAYEVIEKGKARNQDRDLVYKITLALTGHTPQIRVLDPEVEALEAEFRPLLTAGDATT